MDSVERLQLQTHEKDERILAECLYSAKMVILSRRYPSKWWDDVEDVSSVKLDARYSDLQYRIALDLYNKRGAEGELSHNANGISRSYEGSWVSPQLLAEIIPVCGVSQ